MASSSHKIVIGLFVVILLLTSSPPMLQARMMAPDDRARGDQAHVKESAPSPAIGTIIATALPMPPSPPPSGKPEMAVDAKRWGTTQVTDGSVPTGAETGGQGPAPPMVPKFPLEI